MDQAITQVRLGSAGFLTVSDLAPLADEFARRHSFVNVSVSQFRPPAAGFAYIVLSIDVGEVAKTAAELFLAGWLAKDAEALRSKLRQLVGQARDRFRSEPVDVLLCVQIGRVRFYFHEPLPDEEFMRQIEAARQYVRTLPVAAFSGEPGPGEYGHVWDKRSGSWKGQVYQVTQGEFVHILQYTVE